MWLPIGKIIATIIILLTTNAGEAGNPADEIAGYPPGKASNVNYYRDKFEQVKQELENLKKEHAKHEPPLYKLGEEYKPTYGQTVKRIRDRGYMICGSYDHVPGFSEKRGGNWDGFEIEICRAIAIAVMGE